MPNILLFVSFLQQKVNGTCRLKIINTDHCKLYIINVPVNNFGTKLALVLILYILHTNSTNKRKLGHSLTSGSEYGPVVGVLPQVSAASQYISDCISFTENDFPCSSRVDFSKTVSFDAILTFIKKPTEQTDLFCL